LDLLISTLNPDADHQPGRLHKLLLELPWADVFTTNYDTLLERTDVPGRTYQPVTKIAQLTTAFSPRIIKLHGSLPSDTPFIITEEDYRTYPKQFAPFVNSVQQSLLENSFVLIGFSGADPNFLEWTGWIRDELGGNHAPIYLVGALSLGDAERALLHRRGVTPIDLSPLFFGRTPSEGVHAAALEVFLKSLAAAQSPRPEKWPNLTRTLRKDGGIELPPILEGPAGPEDIPLGPDFRTPISRESLLKLYIRWKFERLNYPGWIVLEDGKRSSLWTKTFFWIHTVFAATQNWPVLDRLLLYREVHWRLDIAMIPLMPEWIKPFEDTLQSVFDAISTNQAMDRGIEFHVTESEILDSWHDICFGLLREARETFNAPRWKAHKARIDQMVRLRPQYADRCQYEAALWEAWNIRRQAAKDLVEGWQPSLRSPLACIWKASLLAELDSLSEARTLLRLALTEIRKGLRNHGRNIELLSLEGWCTYVLFSVEVSLNLSRYSSAREEFWERWHELKAWDCSPQPYRDYFELTLSAPPPQAHRETEEIRGFDPGQSTQSYSYRGDGLEPYLPGFGYLRLHEQVGIPLRIPHTDITGPKLANACRWISALVDFWSPAILIRAGKVDALEKGDFLSRTRIAALDPSVAERHYRWSLDIFERELSTFTGALVMDSSQESLFEVLPEVLSRLAFRVERELLLRTFPLALRFHRLPAIRSHISLHKSCEPWFKRLFEAADENLLLEWLPSLIRSPLFDDHTHAAIPHDHAWPDPMRHFPKDRLRHSTEWPHTATHEIFQAIDWLIKRVASETGEARVRGLFRLIDVCHISLMSEEQRAQLANLLWSQRATNGLPDLPHFTAFGFLHLPTPPDVDVVQCLKVALYNLRLVDVVIIDPSGKTSISENGTWGRFVHEISCASKPLIQLRGEPFGSVEWTQEESRELYSRSRKWFDHNKQALEIAKGGGPFGMLAAQPVMAGLGTLGDFLVRAILPKLEWTDSNEWIQFREWIMSLREAGAFLLEALPYGLMRFPDEADSVFAVIAHDLDSSNSDAVASSSKAIRHWIHLSADQFLPKPPGLLLELLIQKVLFRSKPGAISYLWHLACLLLDRPEEISPAQGNLLSASLVSWDDATILPMPYGSSGDFGELERPTLRVAIGQFAGALARWHKKICPNEKEPVPITLWRDKCASAPLPEIRRAFANSEGAESH
jgi:hypothetical protein